MLGLYSLPVSTLIIGMPNASTCWLYLRSNIIPALLRGDSVAVRCPHVLSLFTQSFCFKARVC
jgi:hypothetical protein